MYSSTAIKTTNDFLEGIVTNPIIISDNDSELIDRLFNFIGFYYRRLNCVESYKNEINYILHNEAEFKGLYFNKLQECIDYYNDIPS